MKANQDFELTIESYSDSIKEIARATRKLIHTILPEVVEVVWHKQKITGFGTGLKKNTEHFCWVSPAKKHVTFGFNYGAELPDPQNILEGTGKLYRHFKVKSIEDLSNQALINILTYATTHKVPPISKIHT